MDRDGPGYVTTDADVGIGTTDPRGYELWVDGSVVVSDRIYAQDDINVTDTIFARGDIVVDGSLKTGRGESWVERKAFGGHVYPNSPVTLDLCTLPYWDSSVALVEVSLAAIEQFDYKSYHAETTYRYDRSENTTTIKNTNVITNAWDGRGVFNITWTNTGTTAQLKLDTRSYPKYEVDVKCTVASWWD